MKLAGLAATTQKAYLDAVKGKRRPRTLVEGLAVSR
jgi:hypothetical protein